MQRTSWEKWNGHNGSIFWLTGLSGSGKTTLACGAESELLRRGVRCVIIDGDRLRQGLNRDLGFTEEARLENMRRAMEIADMFLEKGFVVLVPMISPYESYRKQIKQRFGPDDFAEVYVKCSLEECEQRDPKGLYRKARAGEIKDFTGIDSPYETPIQPNMIIDTEKFGEADAINALVAYIESRLNNI
ncbi:adenylyl-sulfate kinase [Paenibacillus sp. 2TAB26]|uniref:adenylyl-sulfate kinase n=1 Tax=Paenibacillus sp. 2TAB26 TaxID=3233005 RepID=UPI003F9A0802